MWSVVSFKRKSIFERIKRKWTQSRLSWTKLRSVSKIWFSENSWLESDHKKAWNRFWTINFETNNSRKNSWIHFAKFLNSQGKFNIQFSQPFPKYPKRMIRTFCKPDYCHGLETVSLVSFTIQVTKRRQKISWKVPLEFADPFIWKRICHNRQRNHFYGM